MPKTIAMLEDELDAARERCMEAEQNGEELIQYYLKTDAAKDAEIEALKAKCDPETHTCDEAKALRFLYTWSASAALLFFWYGGMVVNPKIGLAEKWIFMPMFYAPWFWYFSGKKFRPVLTLYVIDFLDYLQREFRNYRIRRRANRGK